MDEMLWKPATELAQLVRSGEITATALVEASLSRIDALDGEIGAFTHVAHEHAREAAGLIDAGDPRPFAGVPIAIKDNRAVQGMPLSFGSDLWGDFVASGDAYFVSRLRQAGFVIVGKTKLPEGGILPTCEPRRGGPANNPWDLTRTPGGSSGGAAAAVAAGMVPVAHGNDGGGSIRIPAACCGLVGLKAQRGRISVGPDSGQSFLVSDGVLTRTTEDSAAILDLLQGYELGDATWAPQPDGSYLQATRRPPGPLKIGLALNMALEGTLDPVCAQGARDAAGLLQRLGHEVAEVTPPWSGLELLPDFTRAFGPGIAMMVVKGFERLEREPTPELVEPLTWLMYERAQQQTTISYLKAQSRLERVARDLVRWMSDYDVILTPALAQRPLKTGEVHGRGPDPAGNYSRSGAFTPYTAIINVTGQPAISVPLYQGEDGLPLAVQLIGRPAAEATLLSLAHQLEQSNPWAQRRADI
jgi:amidase